MAAATQTVDLAQHPEARISPIKFGMMVFIGSETMFFAALFGAYYTLRAQSPEWPPAEAAPMLTLTLPVAVTIILFISSWTMGFALLAHRRNNPKWIVIWLLVTIFLAGIFLLAKAYEMWTAEVGVSDAAYGTIYEVLLGFHGLHMIAGITMMVVVISRVGFGAYQTGLPKSAGLEATGYYWHFVDLIWLGVFTTIWLMK